MKGIIKNLGFRQRVQAIAVRDFVDVRFNAVPNGSVIGTVTHASAERLRIRAHEVEGLIESQGEACLDFDLIIPMTSILWVRHMRFRPESCACTEDL